MYALILGIKKWELSNSLCCGVEGASENSGIMNCFFICKVLIL